MRRVALKRLPERYRPRTGTSTGQLVIYISLRLIHCIVYLCAMLLGNLQPYDNNVSGADKMETTKTTSRIHPLTAAAAVSVIVERCRTQLEEAARTISRRMTA